MTSKRKYIIANWKSNLNSKAVKTWFVQFASLLNGNKTTRQQIFQKFEIVICPPFPYLDRSKDLCLNLALPFKLGAQDVSPFGLGPYTGEVTAQMIGEFADYVLIGHSERRKYFHEDSKILEDKVKQARGAGLIPIYCVQDEKSVVQGDICLVAYEPVWAIGSGRAESAANANKVGQLIKNKNKGVEAVIYGGSVTKDNIASFMSKINISGVLVGGASLEADSFWKIIIGVL